MAHPGRTEILNIPWVRLVRQNGSIAGWEGLKVVVGRTIRAALPFGDDIVLRAAAKKWVLC
jgi:hypothetical protein